MSKEQSSQTKGAQKAERPKDAPKPAEAKQHTPENPKLVTIPDDAKILRVTRVKIFGKQKLYAICEGYDTPQGIAAVPTFRKYKVQEEQPNGDLRTVEKTDYTLVTTTKDRYDVDYTKEAATKLMDRCVKDAVQAKFSFKEGGHSTPVKNPENFLGDFDEVMRKARLGELV